MSGGVTWSNQKEMDYDKEKMQALLETFTTTVDPSCFLDSLPNSRIHDHNNSHSCINSNNSINSGRTSSSIPPLFVSGNIQLGSNLSCSTNTSLTPQPVKKLRSPDSDTGTDLLNICRICQLPGDGDDFLFSPCRCSGSLQFVHYSCLLICISEPIPVEKWEATTANCYKWIDISTRKTKKIPKCELCQFMYVRHKRFKFHNWRLPRVSSRDICLHTMFLITLVIMIICAVATVMCFLSDNGQISQAKTYLTTEEVITLTCGVMFFVSFFLAMTAEIKARHTVYRLFLKFIMQNMEWHIEPYDKARDLSCPKPNVSGV